eukprot:CAMPEP_0194533378 /NCGR_PEP_ID=MMETSP0253-20130528/71250_1 /TAXON_ID=2966 /ORGANISM="Noctiluca scintillans" /LENGTH=41 /DNA_ID= /DNA_START= /DNA_END= /DNA_ORIENTATION=
MTSMRSRFSTCCLTRMAVSGSTLFWRRYSRSLLSVSVFALA